MEYQKEYKEYKSVLKTNYFRKLIMHKRPHIFSFSFFFKLNRSNLYLFTKKKNVIKL